MANSFPALPSGMNIIGITYSLTLQQKPGSSGAAAPVNITDGVIYRFSFSPGVNDAGGITPDYSGFDQDDFETSLVLQLDELCSFIAGVSGIDVATVKSDYVVVTRRWESAADSGLGSGFSPSFVDSSFTDVMTYPAA